MTPTSRKFVSLSFVKDPVIYDILHVILDFPVEVNVFGTSIWDEGKARLIMGLPKLRHVNSVPKARF